MISGRILVVDDNPAMCDLLQEILEDDGHKVDKAMDAAFAMGMCKMIKYDLIMSDIMMPVMGGIQLLKNIQDSSWNGRPACILMTGSLPQNVEQELTAISVFTVLRKPFALDNMRAQVHQAIKGARSRDKHANAVA